MAAEARADQAVQDAVRSRHHGFGRDDLEAPRGRAVHFKAIDKEAEQQRTRSGGASRNQLPGGGGAGWPPGFAAFGFGLQKG